LHRQEVFAADYRSVSLPVSESTASQCLSLPMFPEMTVEQVHAVVDVLKGALS
jgi:dTDP-4-amino-4,6-dideoxygalactose transaminase